MFRNLIMLSESKSDGSKKANEAKKQKQKEKKKEMNEIFRQYKNGYLIFHFLIVLNIV